MNFSLVGRKSEIAELESAWASPRSELVALYGRRRVGKTFLVRQVYAERIVFEVAGLLGGNKREQLRNFTYTLRQYFPDYTIKGEPKDWLAAFHELSQALDTFTPARKKVLFFDELPWLASARSGFLRAFGGFWNTYAEKRDLVIVICGSAASWMIRRVIQDRGGLHNRITKLLALQPFTLAETSSFCQARSINFSQYQLLQIYMTLGGIPAYLEQLRAGESAVQNIQRICFSPSGFLRGEFDRLFASLFTDYEQHLLIVRKLAERREGLTREELRKAINLPSGGSLTRLLNELYESGFIGIYASFDKNRNGQLYRLVDAFTLFYLTFIRRLPKSGGGDFHQLSELPGWKSWSGYAFENVWLSHPAEIKVALGIEGVSTRFGTFQNKGTGTVAGVQIDLLIDRRDHTINICEAKFNEEELLVSRKLTEEIARKKRAFREHTNTKKQLMVVLLTMYGTKQALHSLDHIDQVLDMSVLL
ncbi:MAG: ATP-binding protein [Bacteroidota bacterium]